MTNTTNNIVVPEHIQTAPGLRALDKMVYAVVWRVAKADKRKVCRLNQAQIAEEAGCSVQGAHDSLHKLERLGWLTRYYATHLTNRTRIHWKVVKKAVDARRTDAL